MKPGFAKARESFAEYATRTLKLARSKVDTRYEQWLADRDEHTVGKLWALMMEPKDHDDPRSVQGWALPDGTVVTPEQNLGVLFEGLGLWRDKPATDPDERVKRAEKLAGAILWAWGSEYRIGVPVDTRAQEADLHLEKDGSGTLVFYVIYQQAPGGGYPAPPIYFKCTVTLTADHKATLTSVRVAPNSDFMPEMKHAGMHPG